MPEGTDERILQNAVRAFARKTFSNHRYVMALHLDTNHPHVHLTVQNAGFNRRKLQIKRGDPQSWREVFAHELDKRGIEAEATPRAVRGVVLKSTVQVLKHMKARGVRLYSAKMTESIRQAWTHPTPRPWEKTIKDNQASLRAKWLELAATYASTDKNLSNKIKQFVDNMPLPLTKREMINQKIFHSIRDKTQAHKLMHDHPELKQDIAIIHKAETIAKHKYTNQEQQEHFIQKIINHVAHKRLQGQGIALMKEKEKDFER
jgi:type I site-specific restriction endonuclease